MNRSSNRRLVISLFVLSLLAMVLYLLFGFMTKSEVQIRISEDSNLRGMVVLLNGEVLNVKDADKKLYVATVSRGEHLLEIKSADYEDYSEKFNTSIRSVKNIDVQLTKLEPKEIANNFYETSDGQIIDDPKIFGDAKNWMVFILTQNGGNGGIAVANLDDRVGKWVVVAEGTDIPSSDPALVNAPRDLIEYLRTGI